MNARIVICVVASLIVACSGNNGTGDGGSDGAGGDNGSLDGTGLDAPGMNDVTNGDGLPGMDVPGGDSGPACGFGQLVCGGRCTTVAVDPMNCGRCGVACAAGQVCFSNGCTSTCPMGLRACAGGCVDPNTDNAHCGACGTMCPMGQGCQGGRCVPSVPLRPGPARCVGGGPPILIDEGGASTCTGSLAMVAFTFALCSCADVGLPALSARSLFDAYDSTVGGYMPGGAGGSVGANGNVRMTSEFRATGDLRTTGMDGLAVGGTMNVGRQLQVSSQLRINQTLTVGRDARVGGTITAGANATIAGTLYTPMCAAVPARVTRAACSNGAVSLSSPCACSARDLVPVQAYVRRYADPARNDNATVGLDAAVFTRAGGPSRLDLPCGYYYLDAIRGAGAVTIAAHGRTALFIGGDVDVSSSLTIVVDPAASLDVFVAGTVRSSALFRVGSAAYPRNTRVYVGGVCAAGGATCTTGAECCSGTCSAGRCAGDPAVQRWSVNLTSNTDLNGLFWAGNGAFLSSSDLEMYGSIFAGAFHNTAATIVHYDLAASRLGGDCPRDPGPMPDGGMPVDVPPPPPDGGTPGCMSCRDCGNQACVGGRCGDCRTDSDCCAPLYCVMGRCVPAPG